jgi:hypothetical protein
MKNPFRSISKLEDDISELHRRIKRLEHQVFETKNSDEMFDSTMFDRLRQVESDMDVHGGSSSDLIGTLAAILRYLNLVWHQEYVPEEGYKPPMPPVRRIIKLVPHSKIKAKNNDHPHRLHAQRMGLLAQYFRRVGRDLEQEGIAADHHHPACDERRTHRTD